MRRSRQIGWKLFAVALAFLIGFGDVPKLAQIPTLPMWQALALPINIVAAAGAIQYAFGRPTFAGMRFWRVFAPFFSLITTVQVGAALPAIASILYVGSGSLVAILGFIVGLGLPLAIAWYANVALLRLGDWLGPTRRPLGEKSPQLSLPL